MKRTFKQTILNYYCLIFYALLIFKWCNHMLLYQQQPIFIYDTFDVVSWLFMQTGIHQWMLQTKHFLFFDLLFYSAPLLLFFTAHKKPKLTSIAAVYVLLVNWIYLQCYFLYPISSYTIFIVWLIFPSIFIARKHETFLLLFEGARYFFLYFFLSAGIWKIANGSIFNPDQLSAILLDQHKEMLTNSTDYWLSHFYQFIINHKHVFLILMYLTVTLMELSFIIGFFTKRFDGVLIIIYFVFLFADYFIMRIPYFETLPFVLTLYSYPGKILSEKRVKVFKKRNFAA